MLPLSACVLNYCHPRVFALLEFNPVSFPEPDHFVFQALLSSALTAFPDLTSFFLYPGHSGKYQLMRAKGLAHVFPQLPVA